MWAGLVKLVTNRIDNLTFMDQSWDVKLSPGLAIYFYEVFFCLPVVTCELGQLSVHGYSLYTLRPDKKLPVFRVNGPYLNLLVKPIIFFRFSEKNIILCILKGEMPFKMHKIIFISKKKKICVPTLPKIFRPIT